MSTRGLTDLTERHDMAGARKPTPSLKLSEPTAGKSPRIQGKLTPRTYTNQVLDEVEPRILGLVIKLTESGVDLPDPKDLARLLQANLPEVSAELDPHYADIGPFYASGGAIRQLGGGTKQALDSRRRSQTVLAMQTGDGTWLYPAWQFTGQGGIHAVLAPVFKALRGIDRWLAGVWLVSDHPDLSGRSPRRALRDGVDPDVVARLAVRDKSGQAGTNNGW